MKNILGKIRHIMENPKIILFKINQLRRDNIIRNVSNKRGKDFFFIQIGANDGIYSGDPIQNMIKELKWGGILVEPLKNVFSILKQSFKDRDNIIFENVAIDIKNGYKDFYSVKGYEVLSSFYKAVLLKTVKRKFKNFEEDDIIKTNIQTLTLEALANKHNVKNIDLLCIDTEGYDYEILKTINFNKRKPKTIIYEYVHLTKQDRVSAINLLKKNMYNYFDYNGYNIFAYI